MVAIIGPNEPLLNSEWVIWRHVEHRNGRL
jgi:hypothetical protein